MNTAMQALRAQNRQQRKIAPHACFTRGTRTWQKITHVHCYKNIYTSKYNTIPRQFYHTRYTVEYCKKEIFR